MTQYDMSNEPIAVWESEGAGFKGGDYEWHIVQKWHPNGTQAELEVIFKRHIMEGLSGIAGHFASAIGAMTNKLGI